MGARQKLNQVYIQIALFVAAIVGVTFDSWLVFFGTLAAFLALSVHSGDIRSKTHRNRD